MELAGFFIYLQDLVRLEREHAWVLLHSDSVLRMLLVLNHSDVLVVVSGLKEMKVKRWVKKRG